ncbi:MAG: carbonate dehydratase [Bacteroidetes bacterium RIFCSPLOWO2_12_FULL_31_6]|nr:MAG: carbonate dehydratase [Bacteroidetes bacterium RIFCSPLOWO2_12_FULL_31_6]
MKTKTLILSVFIALCMVSCENQNGKHEESENSEATQHDTIAENHEGKKHWSYEGETGPSHWAELEKEGVCDGVNQSPINIITKDVVVDPSLKTVEINYSSTTKIHDVLNNGHTIQYNVDKGDFITYNEEKFDLAQIHFHSPAEHTINGVRYPIEIHLVHKNANNQLAVFSVMAQEGESNKTFEFLESYLPVAKDETKTVDASCDLNLNLPKDKKYFYYVGSLTTPPCTEGVNWFVFNSTITISVEQVKKLQELMPINNYRPENPLNGRIVKTK